MKHTSARPAVLAAAALCCLACMPAATAAPARGTTATTAHTATTTRTAHTARTAHTGAAHGRAAGRCGTGELCLWEAADYHGTRHTYELSGTDIESCVALPGGATAQALANRTGRPVTTYQSAHCAETGEFETYPGSGTLAPQTPYRVRAFKIWEN